jgi:hypothetical protein
MCFQHGDCNLVNKGFKIPTSQWTQQNNCKMSTIFQSFSSIFSFPLKFLIEMIKWWYLPISNLLFKCIFSSLSGKTNQLGINLRRCISIFPDSLFLPILLSTAMLFSMGFYSNHRLWSAGSDVFVVAFRGIPVSLHNYDGTYIPCGTTMLNCFPF